MILFLLCFMISAPILGMGISCIGYLSSNLRARLAAYAIGLGLTSSLILLGLGDLSSVFFFHDWIKLNSLNLLLSSLILFVSFIVHRFSLRYMDGDRLYRSFFFLLSSITLSALLMVLADHLFLFWLSWSVSNAILIFLMVHKRQWSASRNSGWITFLTLFPGCICLGAAFFILGSVSSTTSIQTVLQQAPHSSTQTLVALALIVIAAMTQSALFPFHRWLLSSLNSPTPVSGLMHAGIVNGGGILIVKFSSLIATCDILLSVIFLMGACSAFLGTFWKLMNHDIKKMLACSTMAQMGFMMMQCALGLFASAIAHICWHGLFKAYLFLNSGSVLLQKKSHEYSTHTSPLVLFCSFIGGMSAMYIFSMVTEKSFSLHDTTLFILFFAWIGGAELMLSWIRVQRGFLGLLVGFVLASLFGLVYGGSVYLIEFLSPALSHLFAIQLSFTQLSVMGLFGLFWVLFNLGTHRKFLNSKFGMWIYMHLFNASQPSVKTITALRDDYRY